jgi:hypothetical protein
MTAMKGDGRWAAAHEILETDETPAVVGQQKVRHRLARLGGAAAGIGLPETLDKLVDRLPEARVEPRHGAREASEPLVQRSIHVATETEGLFDSRRGGRVGHAAGP